MTEFRSFLTPHILAFIRYRQASQRWNKASYEVNLKLFDHYCHDNYPLAVTLTQDMVDSWCCQRDTEENNSCRSRIYVVASFVRFLLNRSLTDVNEPVIPRKEKRIYMPHAFTDEELSRFFTECDNIPLRGNRKDVLIRKITLPVFFRLLYSSGIRTYEARHLLKSNVNLEQGVLDIVYSKGRDQHYVVLHTSMLAIMRDYDSSIEKICPNRTYFFPSLRKSYYSRGWLIKNFKMLWYKVNTAHATAYEFRHHYAVKNINSWIDQGFGFDDKLLYLSKSMGHTTIESTKYYYSIVPSLSQILKEQTEDGFNWIIPEVSDDEEIN
jgi:integrase